MAAAGWAAPISGLFIATIAVVTAGLIVAGLLPQIAADLGVDIPTAGLLNTGYSLGIAILSPILALMTGGLPRRPLLIAMLAVFVVGNALSAVSTGYLMLLGSRLLVACCHGLVFGLATVMATRLAPEGRKTSAVSLVVAGGTIASVAGMPLGTAIGNAYGWRASFWVLAAAGIVAAIAVSLLIPSVGRQAEKRAGNATEIREATRPIVLGWYAVFCSFMLAVTVLYTYLVPLLTEVSGVPLAMVPWVLFGMGFTGFFGNLVGGRLADTRPAATMISILAALSVIYLIMSLVVPSAWGMTIALWAAWLVGFGLPAPLRSRVIKEAGEAPTFASMMTTTAGNFGSAGGATIGAAALAAGWGYAALPLISAAAAALALLIMLTLWGHERRRKLALA